jgi:hypothetical protein
MGGQRHKTPIEKVENIEQIHLRKKEIKKIVEFSHPYLTKPKIINSD